MLASKPCRRIWLSVVLASAPIGSVVTASALAYQQTHMIAARQALGTALAELNAANKDKGGHRVAAISLVTKAIAEVNAGMAYSNKH